MLLEKEILNFKPKIRSNFIIYSRDEINGAFSLKSALVGEVIVNSTFKIIIDLLDGKNSIGDIIEIMLKTYENVQREVISQDVVKTIKKLIEWQGISWNGKNPFLRDKIIYIDSETTLHIANYLEFVEIQSLLYDIKINQNNYFIYRNPLLIDDTFNYEEIVHSLLGTQIIFNIKRNDKLLGVLIFENDKISLNILKLIIINDKISNNISKCIKYAINEIQELSTINSKCFRAHLRSDTDLLFKQVLTELNFNKVILLKDELGENIDLEEISYFSF